MALKSRKLPSYACTMSSGLSTHCPSGTTRRSTSPTTSGNCFYLIQFDIYLELLILPPRDDPRIVRRRERGMTLEWFDRLIGAVHDEEFQLLLRCLREPGAGPCELRNPIPMGTGSESSRCLSPLG